MHNYAFIARKALWSYHDRLATVVWDMGFVIQVGFFLCAQSRVVSLVESPAGRLVMCWNTCMSSNCEAACWHGRRTEPTLGIVNKL